MNLSLETFVEGDFYKNHSLFEGNSQTDHRRQLVHAQSAYTCTSVIRKQIIDLFGRCVPVAGLA